MSYLMYVDGSSLGNPGPAGIGVAIYESTNSSVPIRSISESIEPSTNNEAEYHALIRGLEAALEMSLEGVDVLSDSQLLVRQVKGEWEVREPRLKPLCSAVRELMTRFSRPVTITLIPRQKNVGADALAQRAARKASGGGHKIGRRGRC